MKNELHLYGMIGDAEAGLDAKTVTAAIRAANGDLSVYINSPGGFVFEGLPIYEALAGYDRGEVTVFIDGLAASMASVVAMAGDQIIMAESALMMIHRPWDSTIGNAADLRSEAAKLEKLEGQLIAIYAKRTGLDPAVIAEMMAAETWFDASEALALGFITGTSPALKVAAMADVSAFGFRHPPESLKGYPMLPTNAASGNAGPMNAAQIKEVRELVEAYGLPRSLALEIFNSPMNVAQARAHILAALASDGDGAGIGHTRPANGFAGGETLDNPVFHATQVENAIYARLSGKAPQGAAVELMNSSLVDLAREMLARRGVNNAYRMRPNDVLDAASWGSARGSSGRTPWLGAASQGNYITHGSPDFPNLLQNSGQRFLIDMYQMAETVLKKAARERTARDFRAITGVTMSGFGALPKVSELAEFTSGTFYERAETYSLASYGKMFGISRQALVNDDLGAFADMFKIMGRAGAETEAGLMAGLLNSNPVLSDGFAVFSTQHGNLAAVAAAPSVASFDVMRTALRQQKDLDGVTLLNGKARYIVVPSALETAASVICTAVWQPNAIADANPYPGLLEPLVEPRLTSATAWYGFADPNMSPVLEYAYLDGVAGPQVEMREGWSSLGQEFRVYHHFGAGYTGSAGAFKNNGV